ncbi:ABC transporter ATP-binding protein [Catellatospora citrea]|uniref:ABC transporter ATP-binding protein n=1 Tax=Catellatospora citrea TaxID=53366 RepID=A0A8J3P370_9ACTN|nr:ABC transporter ATP-binding protein [Catellatospora citrea]RKE11735.1 amino acid/amide ABC transporter ATP-binding protein 1 (HAAT family) [Catellatospora citrea]GIF99785.1 ABC transporter ATP-binding protein [Catellatospora citrea]
MGSEGSAGQHPALRARGLTKEFRGFRAVDGVDLAVAAGSVHALVGPNGAGKTTLFNLLTGFLPPTAGRIEVAGADLTGLAPEGFARRGVARSFQITSLFGQLTALEHVELALQSGSSLGWQFWRSAKLMRRYTPRAMELLDMVGLADLAHTTADALAYGRKRALELALALALEPSVLLLDEPTAGMGLEDVDRTIALIAAIRAGRTVVMVEHNMSVVGALADRVTVLQAGRVLVEGPYDEVRADERVITAYLGEGAVRAAH